MLTKESYFVSSKPTTAQRGKARLIQTHEEEEETASEDTSKDGDSELTVM